MKRLIAFIFALIVVTAGFVPAVAHGNEAKQYEERIVEYNLQKSSAASVQEWIDGELTRYAGIGSEWYVIALSNHGEYDFSGYKSALNRYLSENEVGSASSRLKYALTYIAIGDKSNPYINKVLGNSIGEQGIMSLVFGLHLLNNGCKSDVYSANGLAEEIISLQLDDGGFSVMGNHGDVDVTAMAVQALAARYNDNPKVKSAVDAALDFLSARQLEDGGYSAYGVPNPESSAQIIIALSSLGKDVCTDSRFIKNGNTVFDGMGKFLLDNGSFCHKANGAFDSTATAQALCASVAYENFKSGKPPFYIFNENKNVPEEKPNTEITVETTSAQTALTESTSTTKATATQVSTTRMPITESTLTTEKFSEIANTTAIRDSETTKAEVTENRKNETDTARVITVSVCVVSALICIVLLVKRKRKFAVLVIVVTVAIVALVTGISGNDKSDTVGSVTISINCGLVKDKGKSHIPENGIILEETEVEIQNGDTVYDILAEVCKENGILFSANMGYIEGINNLFEMDFGKSSGWIYFVNGEAPSVGCNSFELADGDKIEWHYTCEMGKDLDIEFEK